MDEYKPISLTNRKKLWWTFNDLMKILFYTIPEIQTTIYEQKISDKDWQFYEKFETNYLKYERNYMYSIPKEQKDIFDAIRSQKRYSRIRNGLYQNIYFLFRKIYSMTNCDHKESENIISNYYGCDEALSFTYNTHILIEMRSLFGRMNLCQNNKIIKCAKCQNKGFWTDCIDCNNKHQLLVCSNNENKNNSDLIEKQVYCDKLIEAIRPIDTALKNIQGTQLDMSDMMMSIISLVTSRLGNIFQSTKISKCFCFDCKTFSKDYSYFTDILQAGGYQYYKHYKIIDYLNDFEEYLVGDNQYLCRKCNTKCNGKRITCFKSLPKILMIGCNRLIIDYVSFKIKLVSHRIEYPLIIDMNVYLESNIKEIETEKEQKKLENGVNNVGKDEMLRLLKEQQETERYTFINMIVSYYVDLFEDMNIMNDIKLIIMNYSSDLEINRFCKSIYNKLSKDLYVLTAVVFNANSYGYYEFCLMDLFDEEWIEKVKNMKNECCEKFIVENSKWYHYPGSGYRQDKIKSISIYEVSKHYDNACTLLYRRFDEILTSKPQLNDKVMKECQFYYDTASRYS